MAYKYCRDAQVLQHFPILKFKRNSESKPNLEILALFPSGQQSVEAMSLFRLCLAKNLITAYQFFKAFLEPGILFKAFKAY